MAEASSDDQEHWGGNLITVAVAGDDPSEWQSLAEALGRGRRVSVSGPFADTSPVDAAARLVAAWDAQQLGPGYLCGCDFGGAIALAAAVAAPGRVLGLILVGVTPEPYSPEVVDELDAASAATASVPARRRSPGFMGRLEFITTAALIVVGEADAPFFQRGAELLHGWMPFSRLVRIPGAGHRPQIENAPAFVAEVAAFLREMEAARSSPS